VNVATMGVDGSSRNRQPQAEPGSIDTTLSERVKQIAACREPSAFILDFDDHPVSLSA
jgi:hypothetical protein